MNGTAAHDFEFELVKCNKVCFLLAPVSLESVEAKYLAFG